MDPKGAVVAQAWILGREYFEHSRFDVNWRGGIKIPNRIHKERDGLCSFSTLSSF